MVAALWLCSGRCAERGGWVVALNLEWRSILLGSLVTAILAGMATWFTNGLESPLAKRPNITWGVLENPPVRIETGRTTVSSISVFLVNAGSAPERDMLLKLKKPPFDHQADELVAYDCRAEKAEYSCLFPAIPAGAKVRLDFSGLSEGDVTGLFVDDLPLQKAKVSEPSFAISGSVWVRFLAAFGVPLAVTGLLLFSYISGRREHERSREELLYENGLLREIIQERLVVKEGAASLELSDKT